MTLPLRIPCPDCDGGHWIKYNVETGLFDIEDCRSCDATGYIWLFNEEECKEYEQTH